MSTFSGGQGKTGLRVTGIEEVQASLTQITRNWRADQLPVVVAWAQMVIGRSQNEFVPFDRGDLRDAAYVSIVPTGPGRSRVEMGYAGLPYIVAVHEHLSVHSPHSWKVAESTGRGVHFRVGGPKFLERPLLEEGPDFPAYLAEHLELRD